MLSNQAAEVLAKENRIPGRSHVSWLDPLVKEIHMEKIVALSMKELQRHDQKYLDEFRNYFER